MMQVQVGLMSRASSSIGELSRRTAKAPSAIRHYEQIGLVPAPARVSGRRRYTEDDVRSLAVIGTAQRAGLTLDEIKLLLEAEPGDRQAVDQLRGVAERKLPEVDAMIERALVVRRWLDAAARCECPSLDECCLFEQLLPDRDAVEGPVGEDHEPDDVLLPDDVGRGAR
jgi:MerR family transcriptional regulator, redox-sensitive transcriptional activator SoxR